jgi:hypothetical protein
MSPHQSCAQDVLSECQQIVFELSEARPGDTIKAQLLRAERNAGGEIDYWTIWRCWRLRGGPKVLAKLREAKRRFDERKAGQIGGTECHPCGQRNVESLFASFGC